MSIMKKANQDNAILDLTLDYHAHILPECDHGSDSVEISQKQVAMAKEAGIQTICATPHFYPHKDSISSFLTRRAHSLEVLRSVLTDEDPQVIVGAETLICDAMEKMDGLCDLCLQGTNELLLEMPFYKWPESIWETIFRLNDRSDLQIVIAHADRYPIEDIEVLIQAGIPLQLNVKCLLNPFRLKTYLSWIKKNNVWYLGSDIHMLGKNYQDWIKCRKVLSKRL